MMNVELRHLRYFIAVAEELHSGRAAQRLHIVQPALSMQIRALEAALGTVLLQRDRRGVVLTEPGRLFLQQARNAVGVTQHAVEMARRAGRGEVGRLVVGYSGAATYSGLLPRLVRRFRRRIPEVTWEFREMHPALQWNALLAGGIDVGIAALTSSGKGRGVAIEHLESWELLLALSATHRLAALETIPLEQLREEAFITYTALDEELGAGIFQELGDFVPLTSHRVGNVAMVLSLVAAELGVALVPSALRDSGVAEVLYRPLAEALPRINVGLLHRDGSTDPLVRAFVAMAAET